MRVIIFEASRQHPEMCMETSTCYFAYLCAMKEMYRTFRARITTGQLAFLLLVAGLIVWAWWFKHIIIVLLLAVLMVVCMERLLHTEYVITSDGTLHLSYGRFARSRDIPAADIVAVERAQQLKIGSYGVMRCVLVHSRDGRTVALMPANEDEFVRVLLKRTAHGSSEEPKQGEEE